MKKTLILYSKRGPYDELYTPIEAVEPIVPFLPKEWTWWEPTDFGDSQITRCLKASGFKIFGTCQTEIDFLTSLPQRPFDAIITNPPYSLKDEFLARAYEIKKPFCFLLPITTLEGIKRGKMFREHGLQVAVLDRRVNFLHHKKRVWFNTSWFCWKILPKDLIFLEVKRRG